MDAVTFAYTGVTRGIPQLNYLGDRRAQFQLGQLCGSDATGRVLCVESVAYYADTDRTVVELTEAPPDVKGYDPDYVVAQLTRTLLWRRWESDATQSLYY